MEISVGLFFAQYKVVLSAMTLLIVGKVRGKSGGSVCVTGRNAAVPSRDDGSSGRLAVDMHTPAVASTPHLMQFRGTTRGDHHRGPTAVRSLIHP